MNHQPAESDVRRAPRGPFAEEMASARGRRFAIWTALAAALGIPFFLWAVFAPGGAAPTPQRAPAAPTVELPSTPAAVTAEALQGELEQLAEDLRTRFADAPQALHVAAVIHFDLLQPTEAEAAWRACLQAAPNHLGALLGLGVLATERGEDEAAVERLRSALALESAPPSVYHRLAVALTQLGRLEEARGVLGEGVEVYPTAPEIWLVLGQTQIQLERYAEAEASLRQAVALAPALADAHYSLAAACARQGKDDEAEAHRRRFRRLRGGGPPPGDDFETAHLNSLRRIALSRYEEAAAVYSGIGDTAAAEALLLRTVALFPELPVGYRPLGTLYRELGRTADAQLVYRRLVEVEPDHLAHYVHLATTSAELGDSETAETGYRTVLAARPDAAFAYAGLARICLEEGRLPEARWLAEESLRWEPTAEGHLLLGEIHERSGDRAAALAARAEAQRLEVEPPAPAGNAP